ncbi:MAG: TolC family protein, partial [Candidatus Cryptobacteroides sp.]
MALEYSHDLKAAEKNISASMEIVKAAQKDLAPRISGDANFKYTGNPLQLQLDIPALGEPISVRGQSLNYGVSLSLMQPVYAGGLLLESINKANMNWNLSSYQEEYIRSGICLQSDLQYWNTVAMKELLRICEASRDNVASLTETIRERVEAGVADRQDLLMMEVRLNEAEYQYLLAKRNLENSTMALNSLIGLELDANTPVEDYVAAVTEDASLLSSQMSQRPEEKIAREQINIAKSNWRIADSKYKPQLYVGADGLLSSPGYNFRPDIVPNYAVYAKLTVPICQWGKRGNEKKASESTIGAATDNLEKVSDAIRLEIQTSRNSLLQAVSQVELSENSLEKARENETMAIDRYDEGKASVTEVIDAQTFRLGAEVN